MPRRSCRNGHMRGVCPLLTTARASARARTTIQSSAYGWSSQSLLQPRGLAAPSVQPNKPLRPPCSAAREHRRSKLRAEAQGQESFRRAACKERASQPPIAAQSSMNKSATRQEPAKSDSAQHRCGFVALIGPPNAGKSTLINALVGFKVAAISHKVQTTRTLLRAIAIAKDAQLVFVDTPGIFTAKRRLDRAMVASAWAGANETDI